MHMRDDGLQLKEPVASLILLAQHLDGARFHLFWPLTESIKDTLAKGTIKDSNDFFLST